ncbi:MAG: hypothetical protein PF486_10150 [Prolixibacteraceae bacterium]|jgi:hypothetical protein|nr:hypothetical protein [Prolixibacteraceae bacterium]
MNVENTHTNTEQRYSSVHESFGAAQAVTCFAGNVRATISDHRFRDADNDTYYPELLSTNTYYPFGMDISSLSVQVLLFSQTKNSCFIVTNANLFYAFL